MSWYLFDKLNLMFYNKTMTKNILEIKNLTKYYGCVKGIENLSLNLKKGEILGFIGPNGAGKSTTIRTIMHLINKTSGEILINNKPFLQNDLETKKLIGYLPSEISLYDDFTVKQMLDFHEQFYKKNTHTKRLNLTKRLSLDESKKIEDLSLGNLKKLGIILALMHEPEILILDEATSGLDPLIQKVFYEILLEEKQKGTSILYSTHILSEVSKLCDRVAIIKDGELIEIENIEELKQKNLTFVTIKSNQCLDIKNDFDLKENIDNDTIRFAIKISHNELIQKLTYYNIDKILIEEPTLDDMFIHYYK